MTYRRKWKVTDFDEEWLLATIGESVTSERAGIGILHDESVVGQPLSLCLMT